MSFGRIALVTIFAVTLAACLVGSFYYSSDLSKQELSAAYTNESSKMMALPCGAQMHYRDEGRRDGPVLVMIHGGFGSLHNWEGWVSSLKSDYRLISMDLLGHGLTGKYPASLYDRHTQRDAVRDLLAELGIESYYLAGNSFGGGISIELALQNPNQIKGLILVDSEGLPNGEEGYDVSSLNDGESSSPDQPSFTELGFFEAFGLGFIGSSSVRSALESMIHDKNLVTDELVKQFTDLIRHEGNRQAQMLMFRQGLYLISQNGPQDLLPRLHEITAPTLIVQGEEDTLVPMRVAKRFSEAIKHSELAVISDAGHMPMLEAPEKTAKIVKTFIDRSGTM